MVAAHHAASSDVSRSEEYSGPTEFEIQMEESRPIKCNGKGPAISPTASPTSSKRKAMCLPTAISMADGHTPLIQRSVRRSIRL